MVQALRWWVLVCIRAYQRWLSPWKGYRCAHGAQHGESCSAAGLRIVQTRPPAQWLPLMREQFGLCAEAAREIADERRRRRPNNPAPCRDNCRGCRRKPDNFDKGCDCLNILPDACEPNCCDGIRLRPPPL